ncbi:uncharacterized protein LOC106866841 [Brachypodium distachyon]|uniref:Peptidase S1 domain-containing protein n=1 Tax=Brachypodium distachyon TaxID=15368 RepID=A0A0Q3EIA5_BRADI|nr:uncharacterized protein LOC106866841 [Brachypodium distachyon]KQJ86076.1 hypothetical protein BRADI_4g03135v3 [Brachypodium distachyon]PNT62424.1 hypothetical protein BRADI_4g03135v3 [Brachypodium distachyon]|eukprot:XP_014758400.1 uncharacterized protein LOC106866841 [Brachypodium distachyon]
MGGDEEARRAIRKLLEEHLESVVCLRVYRELKPVTGREDGESSAQAQGQGDDKTTKPPPEKVTAWAYATGSVTYSCHDFALVLFFAHAFTPYRAPNAAGPGDPQQLVEGTRYKVDFVDGVTKAGHLAAIDWAYDLSLTMIFMDKGEDRLYRPVKFVQHDCPAMGFSNTERNTRLCSIYCFPTEQPESLFGTSVSGEICAPLRLGREIDPTLYPDLSLFQFVMEGAEGSSGAPLFTENRQVMGIWISQIGGNKFGVLVKSICEWLYKAFNIKRTYHQQESMTIAVAELASTYSRCLGRV